MAAYDDIKNLIPGLLEGSADETEMYTAANYLMNYYDSLKKKNPIVLKVWFGPMPESNGKTNWTAILYRDTGDKWDWSEGFTLMRSECKDRVRYEADKVRYLIGEISDDPDITTYDADLHSGYKASSPAIQETSELNLNCRSVQARLAEQWGYVKKGLDVTERFENLMTALEERFPLPEEYSKDLPESNYLKAIDGALSTFTILKTTDKKVEQDAKRFNLLMALGACNEKKGTGFSAGSKLKSDVEFRYWVKREVVCNHIDQALKSKGDHNGDI